MAAKAKLSILGLYRWNPDIFKNMALPGGVDGEILTWKILEDCSELEVLYSDPEYMQASLYNWSSVMLPSWTKIQEALTAKYNPIWNKDGTIRERYHYGAISTSGNSTDKVAGFNSDTTHNRGQAENASRQEAHTDTTERIEQGNIGVTESSAMVRHEVELRQDYNIYSIITADFKKHYCLMVY